MRRSLCALGLALSLSLLACRKPACRGQLSQDDLRTLRAKGDDACSELAHATVRVDDEGLFVDGSRIGIVFSPNKRIGVPLLDVLLGGARDNWKAIHEGKELTGSVALEIPPALDVGPGVSVAAVAAQAGYRLLDVHSGELAAKLDWWLPAPKDGKRLEIVHVEQDGQTHGFLVRLSGDATPRIGHRFEAADGEAAAKAIAQEWAATPGPPPSALVVRVPNGTFHDALGIVQGLRVVPELAAARVAIEIGAPSR